MLTLQNDCSCISVSTAILISITSPSLPLPTLCSTWTWPTFGHFFPLVWSDNLHGKVCLLTTLEVIYCRTVAPCFMVYIISAHLKATQYVQISFQQRYYKYQSQKVQFNIVLGQRYLYNSNVSSLGDLDVSGNPLSTNSILKAHFKISFFLYKRTTLMNCQWAWWRRGLMGGDDDGRCCNGLWNNNFP